MMFLYKIWLFKQDKKSGTKGRNNNYKKKKIHNGYETKGAHGVIIFHWVIILYYGDHQ